MSKFTKDEQTEIVRWALNYEAAIQSEDKELARLKNEEYSWPPSPPVRETISLEVKPVKPDYSALPKLTYKFDDYMKNDRKNNPTFLNKILGPRPFIRGLIVAGISMGLYIFSLIFANAFSRSGNPLSIVFALGSFLWLGICILTLIGIGIYYMIKLLNFSNIKKKMSDDLKQQPHYLQAKAQAEMTAQQKQAEMENELKERQAKLDEKYAAEKEEYEMVIMPKYEADKAKWEAAHETKIQVISNDLDNNKKLQTELYDTTGLISQKIRSLDRLLWIYEDMSTSEHDIERATDLLYSELQLEATLLSAQNIQTSINNMHNDMLEGMSAIYSEIEYGNYVLDDVSASLNKTRRHLDAHIIASGVQQHNTNKQLNSMNQQFVELSRKFG